MKSTHTSKYANFRKILKQTRIDQGLTQKKIAGLLNVPQSFVSKYESGERRLDVIEFLEVAQALNTEIGQILKDANLTP